MMIMIIVTVIMSVVQLSTQDPLHADPSSLSSPPRETSRPTSRRIPGGQRQSFVIFESPVSGRRHCGREESPDSCKQSPTRPYQLPIWVPFSVLDSSMQTSSLVQRLLKGPD